MRSGHDAQPILLASGSPRRRELLDQIGVAYVAQSVAIDETPRPDEDPGAYVQRLAIEKALAGTRLAAPGQPVLGADTTVVVDAAILGKPRDDADAQRMLASLGGRVHHVASAVAVALGDRVSHRIQVSEVEFAPLTAALIRAYVATGEGRDKAGAYAVQGQAARFITRISGSYSGIMGLPLFETCQLLDATRMTTAGEH